MDHCYGRLYLQFGCSVDLCGLNLQLPALLIFKDHCLGWQITAMVAVLYLQFACSVDLCGSQLWLPQGCQGISLLCLIYFCAAPIIFWWGAGMAQGWHRDGAGMAQWWEHSPPTNVAWDRFSDPLPYVGWVCCWFSSLLERFFPGYSGFPLSSKKPTFPNSNLIRIFQ